MSRFTLVLSNGFSELFFVEVLWYVSYVNEKTFYLSLRQVFSILLSRGYGIPCKYWSYQCRTRLFTSYV